ncbi:GspH/FimT family pseudopilin [Saliniradius amylolyticus]|uniref:GspH/FimT family pseudopilin n=1 Tax=Saliniradius amylolyticus TaxID=2183582 RepID=UPI0013A53634|nr:GspH/FimT family pseudopilin [Saliniradius amylolyticus]
MFTKYRQSGISLLELMITVAIISIVVMLGAPSFVTAFQTQHLKGASEATYFTLRFARSEAISQASDITVDFNSGANWCVGVSDTGSCDCTAANSCQVRGVEQVVKAADYGDVAMQNMTFVGGESQFDGMRGTSAGNAGSLEYTLGGSTFRVILSNLGRARICLVSGNMTGYDSCA